MIDIISNNPYRILGVYANASLKEIVANRSKMNVFLKVGKAITFPLDLEASLGPVNRTSESVAAADSLLTIEADKLKAAQFWFFNENTQFDVIAANHLSTGDLEGAMAIWQKKESLSSLQNLAVASLIRGQYRQAATYLSKVYAQYTTAFLTALDIKATVTEADLVQTALSTILDSVPGIDITEVSHAECSAAWNEAVKPMSVEPILRQIVDAVNQCRQTRNASKEVRLAAGQELDRQGKVLLASLRQYLSPEDPQFATLSDKVANQVMQAGIDYYNAANDPYAAGEACKLLDAADMLAVGSVVKDRVKENKDILSSINNSLPPADLQKEADAITAALGKFNKLPQVMSNAETLLKEVEPYLNRIRTKTGPVNPYYLSISSVIAQSALNNLIADVNAKQKAFSNDTSDQRKLKAYKLTLDIASKLTERIGHLGMDAETRQRFDNNKGILDNLYKQLPKEPYKVPLIWQIVFYIIMALIIYTCNTE